MKTCDEINQFHDQRQDRRLLHEKLDLIFDVLMEINQESNLKDYRMERWAMLKEEEREQAAERYDRYKEEAK